MDPVWKEVDIFMGQTGTDLCPFAALLDYLWVRESTPGQLFIFADGQLLTRQHFWDFVWEALRKADVDQSKYCGHSICVSAATTAAAKGVENCVIKTLGLWESLAYLQYVKLLWEQVGGYDIVGILNQSLTNYVVLLSINVVSPEAVVITQCVLR